MLQHAHESLRATDNVFRLLLKEREEITVAWHEALQKT